MNSSIEMTQLTLPSRREYEALISGFLKDIEFSIPETTLDYSLEEPVIFHFLSQPWDSLVQQEAIKRAKYTSVALGVVYSYVPRDHKIAYGILSTYMFLIDDCGIELIPGLDEFETRLIQGKPQESPVLNSMLKFLGTMDLYFGPYARAMISKSMVEFVSSRLIENRYNKLVKIPCTGAISFPQYFRQRAGIPEPYAQFAFPQQLYPEEVFLETYLPILADIADFVSYANDILSFYKETMVEDEDMNYICNLARARQITVLDALRVASDKALQCVRTIRAFLGQANGQGILDTTEQFIQAYVGRHVVEARYKLSDLDIEILRMEG
jgi:hypothetical protein